MDAVTYEPRVLVEAKRAATRAAKRIGYRDATAALRCRCPDCCRRCLATEDWLIRVGLLAPRQEG